MQAPVSAYCEFSEMELKGMEEGSGLASGDHSYKVSNGVECGNSILTRL